MTTCAWLYREIMQGLQPPSPVDCWTWNNTHGRLTSRDSAEPGPLDLSRTPYWKHWYDLVSARYLGRRFLGDSDPYAHLTQQIYIVKGVQIGGTRTMLSALSWFVDQHPGPLGYVMPDKVDFLDVQGERLRPLFEETPALAAHFPASAKLRQLRLTKRRWSLSTMPLYFLAANSKKDVRSRPLRNVVMDEFDLYVKDCEGEGDPIAHLIARMTAFKRASLAIGVTSPTDVTGHGWRRLCSGSHERMLIECRHCGVHQQLDPATLAVEIEGKTLTIREAVAQGIDHEVVKLRNLGRWQCAECGAVHYPREKAGMVAEAAAARRWVPGTFSFSAERPNGLWVPSADFEAGRIKAIHIPETTIRTGHINSLHSPFIGFSEFAAEAIRVERMGSSDERTAFRNTWWALPTIADQQAPPPPIERIEVQSMPRGQAPAWVQRVVITCDQQDNTRAKAWFPYTVRGIGPKGRSCLIDEGQVRGFEAVDALEARTWWVGGIPRLADVTVMDGANGNMQQYIQQWVASNASRRIMLTGRDSLSAPVVARSNKGKARGRSKRMLDNVRAWYCEPNTWKTLLHDRIENATGEHANPQVPAWLMLPDASLEYRASLGSECRVPHTDRRGRRTIVWRPREYTDARGALHLREDTHWWDCEVMTLVATHVLGWDDLPEPVGDQTPDPRPAQRDQALEYAVSGGGGDWVQSGGGSW